MAALSVEMADRLDGGFSVGSAGRSLGVGVSTSICLSGLWLGRSVTAPNSLVESPLVPLAPWDDVVVSGARGDSGMGSVNAMVLSEKAETLPSSVLTLRRRRDKLRVEPSSLGSRLSPMRPSFSWTAMKFVRTLERGRGGVSDRAGERGHMLARSIINQGGLRAASIDKSVT